MPELIEVLLWVLVANFYCRGVIFDAVYYNPEYLKPRESYVPEAELDLQHFQVLWLAWGKTIEVIIKTRDNKQKSIYISLSTHGQIVRLPRELAVAMPEIPLAFITGDTAICVWHRHHHFIRVKNVMKDRGPSILLDFKGFKKNLTKFYSEPQAKTTPIASLLLNQKYFNGIGNYLRAEILHAADIKPFDSAYKVLGDKQTFHRLTTETREVVRRILQLVGFHYNPYDANLGEYFIEQIIKVYGKGKSVEYPTNRTLWYLGELDGELITQLPEQNPKRSPRPEQVGPFLGWDASVMESFGDGIQFDEYTMKIVRVALAKVGRPPKVLRNGVKTKLGKNIKRRNRNGTSEYEKVPINFPE